MWAPKFLRKRFKIPQHGRHPLNFGRALDSEFKDKKLRVVVWNVFKGAFASWPEDMGDLLPVVDLALLQETKLTPHTVHFLQDAGRFEWQSAIGYLSGGNIPTGVSTGATAGAIESEYFRSASSEPVTKTPKMTLITKYHWKAVRKVSEILVVNVHAINFVRNTHFEANIQQIEDVIKRHKGPLLLAGDFNTWKGSRHSILADMVLRSGLEPVKFRNDRRRFVLDHAFVRDLEVSRAVVLHKIESSDHRPLYLELVLKRRSAAR